MHIILDDLFYFIFEARDNISIVHNKYRRYTGQSHLRLSCTDFFNFYYGVSVHEGFEGVEN